MSTSKRRVILVGCGSISRQELKPLVARNDVELVALVDINEATARERAAEFGLNGVRIATNLAVVLEQEQPEVVVDCTVPSAHADVVIAALEHGCHVLGQKPLADTLENAQRILTVARRSPGRFGIIQTERHAAGTQAMRRFLASRIIGQPHTVEARLMLGAHFEYDATQRGDFRSRMRHVLLLDMAIHTFDAVRWITGCDAVAVDARDWNPAGSWFAHGASALAHFEMTDGVRFVYHGSWCAEGLQEYTLRVMGTRGSARLADTRIEARRVTATTQFFSDCENVDVPIEPLPESRRDHAGAVNDFFDALHENREPMVSPEDNIRSLAMVLAAIRSAEERRQVAVEF